MKFNFKGKLPYAIMVIAVVVIGGLIYYFQLPKEITRYNFYGAELQFRTDLRSAKNVSVYPNEEAILNAVWNPEITNITIAFKDSGDNPIIAVNAFEITYKLSVSYGRFDWFINFASKNVDSFSNLTGTNDNLIIALVPPSESNETKVMMEDSVIYIMGKTNKEFDLSTIKFLMSALNITV